VRMANLMVDVNGQQVQLSAPPFVEHGTMYVRWDLFRDPHGHKAALSGDTLSLAA